MKKVWEEMNVSNSDPAPSMNRLVELTAELVAAYVHKNALPAEEIPLFIEKVSNALLRVNCINEIVPNAPLKVAPAIDPRKSITPDYIVCLEDGKKFKSLKRHLASAFSLTPKQYRERWNLGSSYPMVAPGYARHRSELAKKLWLGRKRKGAA